jgi:hypothetical protein
MIDRHLARDLLLAISKSTTVPAGRGTSRTDDAIRLISQADSTLEQGFITWLKQRGYRLPDAAQQTVTRAFAKPDFVYHRPGGPVAIFVGGPVHDGEAAAERDAATEDRLVNEGWDVLRVRYDDDWEQVMQDNPSVFGEGR